jgi:gp16 family phage-associated protein
MSKTPDQVRREFREKGVTLTEWAKANGFPLSAVNAVLIGHNKGYRGQSHKIAVALGIKASPQP